MIRNHPVDSWTGDTKLNFWEEFPAYKTHRVFGDFWSKNRKKGKEYLKNSSTLMWVLSICYDRKSPLFPQPEADKWEASAEDLFDDPNAMQHIFEEAHDNKYVAITDGGLRTLITEFEKTIDTPLGISLRQLEAKLADRTNFIMDTNYSMDYYDTTSAGKQILKKGTADQLDKMFTNTEKITTLIQSAMDKLAASENTGQLKGGGNASLGDTAADF